MGEAEPCETYAKRQNDAAFKGSRYDFAAMVFETSGAVNDEGRDILRQIIRFASKRECMGNSSFAGRAWARVGCCIQTSVAQAIRWWRPRLNSYRVSRLCKDIALDC